MLFGAESILKNHGGTKINIHTDHCGTISFYAAQTKVIVKAKGGYASLMNGIASLKFKWPWGSNSKKKILITMCHRWKTPPIGD